MLCSFGTSTEASAPAVLSLIHAALGEYMCESLELLPHSIWYTFSFIWKSYRSIAILAPCHNIIAIVDTVKLDTW